MILCQLVFLPSSLKTKITPKIGVILIGWLTAKLGKLF